MTHAKLWVTQAQKPVLNRALRVKLLFEAWKCDAWLLQNFPLLSHIAVFFISPLQPLVCCQCMCMHIYIVLSHAGIPRVCTHEPVPVRWGRLEWYHAWGLVHGTCVSEVNACGRGLYVRVWRWAPDGWMVEIYRLTVALQCDCVGWERDVWLKCCCFHTVTHLSCGRFVLDGFCLELLVTAGP